MLMEAPLSSEVGLPWTWSQKFCPCHQRLHAQLCFHQKWQPTHFSHQLFGQYLSTIKYQVLISDPTSTLTPSTWSTSPHPADLNSGDVTPSTWSMSPHPADPNSGYSLRKGFLNLAWGKLVPKYYHKTTGIYAFRLLGRACFEWRTLYV